MITKPVASLQVVPGAPSELQALSRLRRSVLLERKVVGEGGISELALHKD